MANITQGRSFDNANILYFLNIILHIILFMEKIIKDNGLFIKYNSKLIKNFDKKIFNYDYIEKAALSKSLEVGRARTFELNYENNIYILKHYHRGGFFQKIFRDKYIYTGDVNTRANKEWALLKKIKTYDLPVPEVAAIKVKKYIFTYKADLITKKINNTIQLIDFIKSNKMNDKLWEKLAITLKKFFEKGIYHADLNVNNILVSDNEKFYLVDFDKSFITDNEKYFKKSFARLHRSLVKNIKDKNIENKLLSIKKLIFS